MDASVSHAPLCEERPPDIVILRTSPLLIEYVNDEADACLALLPGPARPRLPAALIDFCLDLLESLRHHDTRRDGWPCHLERTMTTPDGPLLVRGVGIGRDSTCARLYLLLDRMNGTSVPAITPLQQETAYDDSPV